MKKFLTLGFLLLALQEGYGQLGGIKFIPGDYATIAEAIAALNLNGAGPGGVTFNIQAGHQETFSYADAGSITATGNITSRVIFQKAGVGNNPVIVAPTGTGSMDAVIRLIGASYITFDGIDLQENPLNITHPERMEWGYAFLKKSETEGSQNNVIKNCHISLEPSETSGIAIYAGNHTANSLAALLVSSFSGTNSGNLIYGNSCTGTYNGILLSGRADSSFYDQDNQICNNIINGLGNPLSPGSAGSIGINTVNQKDMLITGNTINGTAALASGSCMSIDVLSSTGSLKINQNTISLEYPGTGSFGGIRVTNSNLDSLQVSNNNINNNVIINSTANCPFFWLKSRVIILNFHDNIISENVMPTSSPGSRTCVYTDVSGFSQLQNIHHNSFINNTISGGSNNNFISINGTGQLNFYGNTITNINLGTGTFNIINLSGKNDGNTYDNLIFSLL